MMPSLEHRRSWPSRLRGDAKQSPAAFGLATILAIGTALTAIIYLPFAARPFDVLDLGHTGFPKAFDLDLQDRLLSNRQERLGIASVNGRSRAPRPPARITAFISRNRSSLP